MNIEFRDSDIYTDLKDVTIRNNESMIKIFFGGNGDLYFDYFGKKVDTMKGNSYGFFTIYKEDSLYPLFLKLYEDIVNARVFCLSDFELEFLDEEQRKMKRNRTELMNERIKNSSVYSSLVRDSIIEWKSDSTTIENSNVLRIENTDEGICLSFEDNVNDLTHGFGIRICNSGSRYDMFNVPFMLFFNRLQEISREKKRKLEKNEF